MKKGFTLIELLAVIIVLAIVALIATPIVLDVIEDSKKSAAESEANLILSGLNSYCQNEDSKIQLGTLVEENRKCKETIGDETIKEIIPNVSSNTFIFNIGYKDGKITSLIVKSNGYAYGLSKTNNKMKYMKSCTYEGDLVTGATYINGIYTYKYNQRYYGPDAPDPWIDGTSINGWQVYLTDYTSTAPITEKPCEIINYIPVKSMSGMFNCSQATSIDVSDFNTSLVTDMGYMFRQTAATTITGLTSFDTTKVTNMDSMFSGSQATSLDLSSFDTSNVTNMNNMFSGSQATSLDLSSFDITKANISGMFYQVAATTGYARTQAEADRFNDGSMTYKPSSLIFVVK